MWHWSLIVRLVVLSGLAACGMGTTATSSLEFETGKGWLEFFPLPESPDAAFLRNYVESDEGYEEAQQWTVGPWSADDMHVAYHDLNDDGVPEMFLFLDVSTWYCGSAGCQMAFFQKRDGIWREIGGSHAVSFWVSDEKVRGYRTIYSSRGNVMRWESVDYGDMSCTETLPADMLARMSEPLIQCVDGIPL